MAEAHVGFLCNIASTLSKDNSSHNLLRSYYLMRCRTITHGYGLPQKQFSHKARCPRCCLERSAKDDIKVRPIKLSKRQKKRIKSAKSTTTKQKRIERRKALLCSNELEQICSFCKNKTKTPILKPKKESLKRKYQQSESNEPVTKKAKLNPNETVKNLQKANTKTKPQINLYTSAFDIFALNNKKNILPNTVKQAPKVIKNNKKKKDKFAGLCKQAVLASAKLKDNKQKTGDNKLNLFLKPSS
ncbi:hypothetical protein O3G_MSEX012410 [Manduca sexta]|uniref:Uncharacterized protein n=1 Tax=Manduca sexta TaxID=7130 RepID=A0A921ZP27_MANSE|nr:hypothetical protein O3G_MSEX012410 [Manduca sexta]KAG6461065.1 hypothetical protein O3G_MSEX012410 [Manduca sexta]